jgi:hypothetical protein
MTIRVPDRYFHKIQETAGGDHEQVPAQVGLKIVVTSFFAVAGGAVDITWKSDGNGLTGDMPLAANGGLTPLNPSGLFETPIGKSLVLNLSQSVKVSGGFTYELHQDVS